VKTRRPVTTETLFLAGSVSKPVTAIAAIELVERGEQLDGLPPLRVGVAYGPAVNQWGDWFGSTVNLASRLTARARPSSVLATEEVREAAGDGYAWSSAGPKKLKGFSSPVKTYRVRREPDG
jgi:adenylate cyclase